MPALQQRQVEMDALMAAPAFWDNREQAQKLIDEAGSIRRKVDPLLQLEKQLADFNVLVELGEAEPELLQWMSLQWMRCVSQLARLRSPSRPGAAALISCTMRLEKKCLTHHPASPSASDCIFARRGVGEGASRGEGLTRRTKSDFC